MRSLLELLIRAGSQGALWLSEPQQDSVRALRGRGRQELGTSLGVQEPSFLLGAWETKMGLLSSLEVQSPFIRAAVLM